MSAISGMALSNAGFSSAATITGWNTDNVVVDNSAPVDGITGASVVYDQNPSNTGATSNGQITFTPPEAYAPGIKVQPEVYTQGGSGGSGLTLDGCIMTSNPGAICTSDFQSGKRVKTQVTGTEPLDLVFDVQAGAEANYQMFYRLINATSKSLAGFALEIGFGVGNEFVQATASDGITFSTDFMAKPSTANASVTTQYPFGLFGDASTNPNFDLDGFFAPERSGMDVLQTATSITSSGIFGPYNDIFGSWITREGVPEGAFWDHDFDDSTEALLMAYLNSSGQWEMRRDIDEYGVAYSLTGSDVKYFGSFSEVSDYFGSGYALFDDDVEDLANLNLNFAFNLSSSVESGSFTLRTTVSPVPLPLSAPLLGAGIGLLAMVGRRRKRRTN
ncbi:choice-of-anchor F family protein [uncultured Shimia sp.]|uniref:VPLPA-CTERM sorting domain-containing protein n=1 Tax=uncultured Shimia sp. TaxID=573152 RepID=UPI00260C709E|nr:choice-of-anchor F family protein [uncultured Shimia sp.]